MHINLKYELPHRTVDYLSKRPTSLYGARLLHGLLCQIDGLRGGLPAAGPILMRPQTIWCNDIANLTAARGCKDRRWIQKGVADLSGTDLFSRLEQPDTKRITFLFSKRFRDTFMSKKEKDGFGKMQTEDLVEAISTEEATFIMFVRLTEGRDWPVFDLPFGAVPAKARCKKSPIDENIGEGVDKTQTETCKSMALEWHDEKRRWCRAIERVANRLDHSYLIAPYRGPLESSVSRVRVKIQHKKTKWQPERLYKFQAGSGRVIQVKPGERHRSLSDQELRERLRDTVIR